MRRAAAMGAAPRLAPIMLAAAIAGAQPVPDDLEATDPMVREAVVEHLQALEADPSETTWMLLAQTYDANDYLEEAETCYRTVVELDADHARAWYLLAIVLNDLGEVGEAIDTMARVAEIDSSYAPAWWRRGYWLLDEGRVDEASSMFERVAATEPARFGLARVALARRDAATARALLEPLLTDANLAYAYQLMAGVHRLDGDLDAAGVAMAIGAGAGPRWTDPWLREVLVMKTGLDAGMDRIARLSAQGRHAEAMELIDELLERWPDDIGLLNYKGFAAYGLGRRDEAVALWQDALEREPGHYLIHLNLGSVFAEDALRGDRHVDEAFDHLERAIEANDLHARSYEVMGSLYNALGRMDEAQAYLLRAYDLAPTNALLAAQLTRLYMARSMWPEALGVLERWTRLQPRSGEAHLRHGVVLMELGRYDEATVAVDRAADVLKRQDGTVQALREEIAERRGP